MNHINEYDIDEYTDEELFEILELDYTSCTDKELETRIIGLIQKYNKMIFEHCYDYCIFNDNGTINDNKIKMMLRDFD